MQRIAVNEEPIAKVRCGVYLVEYQNIAWLQVLDSKNLKALCLFLQKQPTAAAVP